MVKMWVCYFCVSFKKCPLTELEFFLKMIHFHTCSGLLHIVVNCELRTMFSKRIVRTVTSFTYDYVMVEDACVEKQATFRKLY